VTIGVRIPVKRFIRAIVRVGARIGRTLVSCGQFPGRPPGQRSN
jgi:hypothetical protein